MFSIIMPSYNQKNYIIEAIGSVLCQEPPIELIVVDGGSMDGTVDVLKHYASRYKNLTYVSEPDRGQADAVNKGVKMASGDIIGWLNSDDVYLRGAVSAVRRAFAANPEAEIVYGDELFVNQNGEPIWECPRVSFRYAYLYWCWFNIGNHAAFWRKGLFEKCGGLDTRYHLTLDYDFFLRLCRNQKPVHIPRYMGAWRIQNESKSQASSDEIHADELSTIRKENGYFDYPSTYRSLMKWREKIIRLFGYLLEGNWGFFFSQVLRSLSRIPGLSLFDRFGQARCRRLRVLLPGI